MAGERGDGFVKRRKYPRIGCQGNSGNTIPNPDESQPPQNEAIPAEMAGMDAAKAAGWPEWFSKEEQEAGLELMAANMVGDYHAAKMIEQQVVNKLGQEIMRELKLWLPVLGLGAMESYADEEDAVLSKVPRTAQEIYEWL